MEVQLPIFPKPDRSNYQPHGKNSEDPSTDIGWDEGFLSDTRPYRAECWAEDGVTSLTFFFSTAGLETMTDDQFGDFLEREGLLRFIGTRYVAAMPMTDASGHDMWSVNVVVGDEDAVYVDDNTKLRPYRSKWSSDPSATSSST